MAKNPLTIEDIDDLLVNFRAEFEKFHNRALEVADQGDVDNATYALAKMALLMAAEQFAAPDGSASEKFQKKIRREMGKRPYWR